MPSIKLGKDLGIELHFKLEGATPRGRSRTGERRCWQRCCGPSASAVWRTTSQRTPLPLRPPTPPEPGSPHSVRARPCLGAKAHPDQGYGAELVEVPAPRPQATVAAKQACHKDLEQVYASHSPPISEPA